MKIGVPGVGKMGTAITKRLMEVGHELTVWNRAEEPELVKPLLAAGAKSAATPAELVGKVEAVITILTNAEALDAVYRGPSGLLKGPAKGKLFINMSTVRPETNVTLSRDVAAAGGIFAECPVGGTVGPALQGKLLGFAAGETAAVEQARPILEQLCRRVAHVGPAGAGASMKLAINLPLAVAWQSLAEAIALCQQLGLDKGLLIELFTESSGGTNVLKARGGAVAKALNAEDPGSATFDCDGVRKDLRLMIEEAKSLGFSLPVTEQTLAVYDEASQKGWGKRDCVELPAYWPNRRR